MHQAAKRSSLCACVLTICLAAMIFPCAAAAADADSPTITPTTGKLDITFNINIATTGIPSNATIRCEVIATVFDASGNSFTDSFAVAGTRSGNTATCQPWYYYSWLLANPGSDRISFSFDVEALSTATNGLPFRDSTQSSMMAVPANGTITRMTVNVTL